MWCSISYELAFFFFFFFFKQKTAYEMRISDWSSDVCSSDLADQAADAVDAEYVERIVEAELRLHDHHEPAAGDTGDRAEQDRAERTRIARCRRDRDEAGDRARAGAEQRALVAERALGQHPEENARRGGDEAVDEREAGRAIGLERRAGIEAEPAAPQQAGADQRHGQRVRRHDLLLIAGALADDQAADERRDARVDVNHRAAREIEGAPRSEEHTSELQSLMRLSYA